MGGPAEIPHDCVRPPAMVTLGSHLPALILIAAQHFRGAQTAGCETQDRIAERIVNHYTPSHGLIGRRWGFWRRGVSRCGQMIQDAPSEDSRFLRPPAAPCE